MLNVSIQLQRFQSNNSSTANDDPYLWSMFFHLDIDNIRALPLLETYTPHSNWTTRGMYPNDVRPGEEVHIPSTMGEYNVTLDDGGFEAALVGFIYVIIDQRGTDGDAIKAAHEAFGITATNALTEFLRSKIISEDKSPTQEETQAIADEIERGVKDAAREASQPWDYFDSRDRMIGFGSKFFEYSDLLAIDALGDRNNVPIWITSHDEEVIQGSHLPSLSFIRDYELFGSIQVTELRGPSGLLTEPYEQYLVAVQAYKDVSTDIDKLRDKLSKAKGGKRDEFLLQLKYARDFTKKAAKKDLISTREAYDNCRKTTDKCT